MNDERTREPSPGRLTEATDIAKRAVAFWVRDYDHRNTPKGIVKGIVEVDENTVRITPTAGMRIWVYCAEMPWDPRDGPEMRRDGLGKRYPEAWCASKVFPDGEYGIIHTDDGTYIPLTKPMFLAAAALGWPDWDEGCAETSDSSPGGR